VNRSTPTFTSAAHRFRGDDEISVGNYRPCSLGILINSKRDRVTDDLTELLTDICGHISVELGRTESALEGRFERFRDVFISDGTICTLSAESFEAFPGLGDDHAGAKLHVIESLASRAPILSSITDARTQETTQLQIGNWVEDSLLLFDLGYLDYARLARIDCNGGWFVSRLNVDANPAIINELRTWCGDTIDLEGMHLQEVLPDLYRQIIDATGTVGADQDDPHLPYDVRIVGVRHEDDEDAHRTEEMEADHNYHLYATNLPTDAFAPRELAALYSNRWSVETVINELKSVFELDEMSVRRKTAVECFIMAALLMVLVSRSCCGGYEHGSDPPHSDQSRKKIKSSRSGFPSEFSCSAGICCGYWPNSSDMAGTVLASRSSKERSIRTWIATRSRSE
jgi:putative transposase